MPRLARKCGHYSNWPINPPSEVLADLADSLCEECWREADPQGAAQYDREAAFLEAEGQKLLAEDRRLGLLP